MALPHHYLAALIVPTGRLNQFGFAVLSIVLAFAHVWVYAKVRQGHALDMWGPNAMALFVMLWMMFCIMSRRMHDTGASGFILVPLLIAAMGVFLLGMDRDILGREFSSNQIGALVVDHGVKIIRSLAVACFLYLIRAGGEDGDNAYGPEFGDGPAFAGLGGQSSGRGAGAKAIEAIEQGQFARNSYRRIDTAEARSWGERRQPKGFGRR